MKSKHLLILLLFLGGSLQAALGKTYLVSVGINDYPGTVNDLNLCTNDARQIVNLYKQYTDVEYLILTDANATADRIVNAMNQLYRKAGKNDLVVFYYSGHGYRGGFNVYDGDLSYTKVRKAFAKSKAKNKLIFADTCHSGQMSQDTPSANPSQMTSEAKKASVMLFLSSRGNEYSLEGASMSNSIFTHYLLEGLKGAADTNNDRTVSAREIYVYVHDGVINRTGERQHPVMWGKFPNSMPVIKYM